MGEALHKQIENEDEHKQKYTAQTPKLPNDKEDPLRDLKESWKKERTMKREREQALVEESRKHLGKLTGEDQLEKLQAQLRAEIATDKARNAKPEVIELNDEDLISDEDTTPPPIPFEVNPKEHRLQKLDRLQKEYAEVTAELKVAGAKVLKHELEPQAILPLTNRQRQINTQIKKLEALIEGKPTMADKIAAMRVAKNSETDEVSAELTTAVEKMKTKQQIPPVKEPTEIKKPQPESKIHDVYGGRKYPTIPGGGGVASVMGGGTDVLMHSRRRRAGEETYTAPERTNEEALFDLDQDLVEDPNKDVKFFGRDKDWVEQESTKEMPSEKLLQKLFRSEISLDKEEYKEILLTDKTFLHALDIEKWNGDLSVLNEVVSRLSLEKSDELVAIKHNKGWFKRLFESPEEKLLKTQMEALDDLLKKNLPGAKKVSTPSATDRRLRAMIKH